MNRVDRRKSELRGRILQGAFDLFLQQGVAATTIEDICDRADVANRTFFNHFPTRQDMMRALAERRLANLHDVVIGRAEEPVSGRLTGIFGDIVAVLVKSGDTYRELIGEMLAASGYGVLRGSAMHDAFVELVKDGVSRGEVSTAHDPDILADIIVGALAGSVVNWAVDRTYSLQTNLNELGQALAGLLTRPPPAQVIRS